MSDKLKIQGVEGFEGEYEFDVQELDMDDLELIEVEAGVRANEFDDALRAGSVRLLRVIATIAIRRAGHPHWRDFRQAFGKVKLAGGPPISYIGEKADEDADPPAAPPSV